MKKLLLLTLGLFCVTIHATGAQTLLTQQPQYQQPTVSQAPDIENQLVTPQQLHADHQKLQKKLTGIKKQLTRIEDTQSVNLTVLAGAILTTGICGTLWFYNLAMQKALNDSSN